MMYHENYGIKLNFLLALSRFHGKSDLLLFETAAEGNAEMLSLYFVVPRKKSPLRTETQ